MSLLLGIMGNTQLSPGSGGVQLQGQDDRGGDEKQQSQVPAGPRLPSYSGLDGGEDNKQAGVAELDPVCLVL